MKPIDPKKYNFVDLSDLDPSAENIASAEELYQEALARLSYLKDNGLDNSVVSAFKKGLDADNSRFYSLQEHFTLHLPDGSQQSGRVGVLYWLDNDDEEAETIKAAVDKVEGEYGGFVYHAIRCRHLLGGCDLFDMVHLFYVSPYKAEWPDDRQMLSEKLTFSWTENITDPDLSEFGIVPFDFAGGGLVYRYD